MQAIIDERADGAQREAMCKILRGESTAPGATHFYILTSMASEVLDALYAPIQVSIDVDARQANVKAEGLVEARGTPIIDAFSQNRSELGSICRMALNTPLRRWALGPRRSPLALVSS